MHPISSDLESKARSGLVSTWMGDCLGIQGAVGFFGASLIAQLVKNPPAVQETPVQILGQEDPLEKG